MAEYEIEAQGMCDGAPATGQELQARELQWRWRLLSVLASSLSLSLSLSLSWLQLACQRWRMHDL